MQSFDKMRSWQDQSSSPDIVLTDPDSGGSEVEDMGGSETQITVQPRHRLSWSAACNSVTSRIFPTCSSALATPDILHLALYYYATIELIWSSALGLRRWLPNRRFQTWLDTVPLDSLL